MYDTKTHRVPFANVRILTACALLALGGSLIAPALATSQDRPVAPQQGQAATPVSADEQKAVVDRIAELLAQRYVFEDKGREAGAHIQKLLADGALAEATDPAAFAAELTSQLQSVTHDKHMRVRAMGARPTAMNAGASSNDPGQRLLDLPIQQAEGNFGFEKVQNLDGNIGYLKLNFFAGDPAARPTASAAMNFLAGCDALIVDLRENGGGSPEMIQWISSYLFDEPTHLNSLYWRQGDRTEDFWTHSDVPGARLGQDVPLFVLTSRRTFSGAEEFSYNIQTQQRGTLIGETTGGGANPGGVTRIGDRFAIFIPTGRAINPITKTNWEGVGVKPEIDVPAAEAYDKALELAAKAATQRREQRQERTLALRQAVIDALRAAGDSGKPQQAALASESIAIDPRIKAALDRAVEEGALSEMAINLGGYGYMEAGQMDPALALLGYNAQRFAKSANVHDSLGEALEKSGRLAEAQESYQRALELGIASDDVQAQMYKQNLDRVTAALKQATP